MREYSRIRVRLGRELIGIVDINKVNGRVRFRVGIRISIEDSNKGHGRVRVRVRVRVGVRLMLEL
jgi:hypothetical protein